MRYLLTLGVLLYSKTLYADLDWVRLGLALPPDNPAAYAERFPLYAETTTMTSYRRFDANNPGCGAKNVQELKDLPPDQQELCIVQGGVGGHGALFLRGACLVGDSPYPQLYNCSQEPSVMADPDSGVGVSLNKVFYNLNWVGIPGRQMFYYGGLNPNERLTQEKFQSLMALALTQGWYRNFKIHPEYLPTSPSAAPLSEEALIISKSIGTDLATTHGRGTFFVRVPINSQQLDRAIAHLNQLNRKLFEAHKNHTGYQYYNEFLNSCAHTSHNTFHAMGILPNEKELVNFAAHDPDPEISGMRMRQNIYWQFIRNNVANPSNVMINVARRGRHGPPDLLTLYRSDRLQQALRTQSLVTGLGSLVGYYPLRKPNDVFLQGEDPLLVSLHESIPVSVFNPQRARTRLYTSPEHTELTENLKHFSTQIRERLQQIEQDFELAQKIDLSAAGSTARSSAATTDNLRTRELKEIFTSRVSRQKYLELAQLYHEYLNNILN